MSGDGNGSLATLSNLYGENRLYMYTKFDSIGANLIYRRSTVTLTIQIRNKQYTNTHSLLYMISVCTKSTSIKLKVMIMNHARCTAPLFQAPSVFHRLRVNVCVCVRNCYGVDKCWLQKKQMRKRIMFIGFSTEKNSVRCLYVCM